MKDNERVAEESASEVKPGNETQGWEDCGLWSPTILSPNSQFSLVFPAGTTVPGFHFLDCQSRRTGTAGVQGELEIRYWGMGSTAKGGTSGKPGMLPWGCRCSGRHCIHHRERNRVYRSTGRAEISRIPFAGLYSQVLEVTLLFSHPRSKMEKTLQKDVCNRILKENRAASQKGDAAKRDSQQLVWTGGFQASWCLLLACSYPVGVPGLKHIGKASLSSFPVFPWTSYNPKDRILKTRGALSF